MLKPRIIPCLLLQNKGFVKTRKFKDPVYLGDPRNIVKIFNEKEVDELLILDINVSKINSTPNFQLLSEISDEAFMPMAYGGGITSLIEIEKLFNIGFEKVILNTCLIRNIDFISEAVKIAGSQSIVICIDVKNNFWGKKELYVHSTYQLKNINIFDYAKKCEQLGAGEIIINSVDRDGTFAGYEINLIKSFTDILNIPVIACGGAKNYQDLFDVCVNGGASAASAGSLFVFQGNLKAVLINFPSQNEINNLFRNNY